MVHPILHFIWTYRKILIVLLTPFILLPLPLVGKTKEAWCGFVILLMAVYWITEALPLAVTSLIPLILFPLTGILKASQVSVLYFKDTNWLMFGGLMIAVAVETSGLHKRIALRVLLIVGVKPRRLMFGFMIVTFFLSMWISNTATTAMLIPIVEAIVKELYESNHPDETNKGHQNPAYEGDSHMNIDEINTNEIKNDNEKENGIQVDKGEKLGDESTAKAVDTQGLDSIDDVEHMNRIDLEKSKLLIIKGMTICIPYAASIGGTASLTGTVPNLVLSGQYEELFPDADPKLSFGIWITYCFPQALVTMLLAYVWLSFWFVGFKGIFSKCRRGSENVSRAAERRGRDVVQREYDELGNIKWEEVTVLVVFIFTALLWFFRDPGYMTGWSVIFPKGFVTDGTVAVTMAFTLFFLPRRMPEFLKFWVKSDESEFSDGEDSDSSTKFKSVPAVLDWPTAQRMFPWDVTLLLGAGFGIAGAATSSGLSAWFGQQLSGLKGIDDWVICLTMTTFICLMTETTSNTATSSLFVPILAELAKTLEVHPLYMLYPPVIAASFAFMLPVATPPNAIAFSYGRISVWDLVKAGWVVNILGILVLTLSINTFGIAFFNLRQFPDWANSTADAELLTGTTMAPCLSTTT